MDSFLPLFLPDLPIFSSPFCPYFLHTFPLFSPALHSFFPLCLSPLFISQFLLILLTLPPKYHTFQYIDPLLPVLTIFPGKKARTKHQPFQLASLSFIRNGTFPYLLRCWPTCNSSHELLTCCLNTATKWARPGWALHALRTMRAQSRSRALRSRKRPLAAADWLSWTPGILWFRYKSVLYKIERHCGIWRRGYQGDVIFVLAESVKKMVQGLHPNNWKIAGCFCEQWGIHIPLHVMKCRHLHPLPCCNYLVLNNLWTYVGSHKS